MSDPRWPDEPRDRDHSKVTRVLRPALITCHEAYSLP